MRTHLELGAEDDAILDDRVVERLDAHAVADQHAAACVLVPDRDGEHAAQALGQRRPVVLVEVGEDLGVAAAAQHVAARAQLVTQGVVVVDLAVLGAPDAAALVGERLVAALDVDDREPAGADARRRRRTRSRRRRARGTP